MPPSVHSFGEDTGAGNLLGVQPWVVAEDFRSPSALSACLTPVLAAAHNQGLLNPKTVVVLPEYLGFFAAFFYEKDGVYRARSLAEAGRAMLLRRPGTLAATLARRAKPELALLDLKASQMVDEYLQVCSLLAATFGVTLVAGSTLTARARLSSQGWVADPARRAGEGLLNVTVVFAPDGRSHPDLVEKKHPTLEESLALNVRAGAGPRVFQTPAGPIGVLICADSWYPDCEVPGARALVVPGYIAHGGRWDAPWGGYDHAPGDAAPSVATDGLTEGQAWLRHALPARCQGRLGLTVFLRGSLWDHETDGYPIVVHRAGVAVPRPPAGQAALVNLWLD